MEANLKAHTTGEHKERPNYSCAEKTPDGLVCSPTSYAIDFSLVSASIPLDLKALPIFRCERDR